MTSAVLSKLRFDCGVAVHRAGEGPTVVLLHGVGLRAECWRAQIDFLRASFTVLVPDLPGHGGSGRLPARGAPYGPTLAAYTDRIAEAVARSCDEPVVVVGHSMGALIALDLALRQPDRCRAIVALNAIFRRSAEARAAVARRAAALADGAADAGPADPVRRWFGNAPGGAAANAAAACRDWLERADPAGYAAAYGVFAREDGPPEDGLAALAVPALFLTGSEDRNSTPAMSLRMAGLAPDARAVTVEGAGHMALMTHAREVNAALADFLAAVVTRAEAG